MLWLPRTGKWGALRLTTTGLRSSEPRSVILGYYAGNLDAYAARRPRETAVVVPEPRDLRFRA